MKYITYLMILLPTTFSKKTYQFFFPDSDDFPHVKLYGTIENPLREYTLCHWSRVNGAIDWGTIFSYNTAEQNRALGTWMKLNGLFHVEENDRVLKSSATGTDVLFWLHSCVTSSPLLGKWRIYLNGIFQWTGESTHEKAVPPYGIVVLGQTHRAKSGFLEKRGFMGYIADLFLWNRVLNSEEIAQVYGCNFTEEANVINWNLHSWTPFNGVQVSRVNLPCGK